MSTKRIRAICVEAGGDGIEPLRNEWILPAATEAYEQMVEQMAKSLLSSALIEGQFWDDVHELVRIRYRERTTEALRAIGITPPSTAKKGRK